MEMVSAIDTTKGMECVDIKLHLVVFVTLFPRRKEKKAAGNIDGGDNCWLL
jgi:hypothetical protein